MKKILLILSVTLLLFSNANAQKEGYNITVKVKNASDSACYLAYYFGTKKYVKDTATVTKNGQFVFKGKDNLPGGIYIVFFPDKSNYEILVNEQNFTIEIDKKNTENGVTFKNSEENSLFYGYLKFASGLNKKIQPLQKTYKRVQERKDNDSIKFVRKQLQDLDIQISEYRDNIIKNHPNKLITTNFKALKDPEIPEAPSNLDSTQKKAFPYLYMKKHFWDNINFSDDNILRTPIYEGKLKKYFEKMVIQTPDSLIKECDMIIKKAKGHEKIFQFTVITLTNKYGKAKIMGLDEVFVHMIEKYYNTGQAVWLDSAAVYRLTDRAKTLKYTTIGKKAPNITMKDTSDKYTVLYNECYADFNILIFWDPDCGHCKKEIPKWDKAYRELKDEYSIHMIGVTTSSLKAKWLKFIRSKGIDDWQHLYDPDYTSPFRQYYDITSTPKVYIIGKDKKLIA